MNCAVLRYTAIFLALIVCHPSTGVPVAADEIPAQHFICPPCNMACDNERFSSPGNCPTCGMTLIPQNAPQSLRNSHLRAIRIDGDITLSGKLDDPRWQLADMIELSYETQPGENIPASQRTTVRILYNANYVYFGYTCQDTNPSSIRAHVTERDKVFEDDFVFVWLDTFGDNQKAYAFVTNPYGIQADFIKIGSLEDMSFDAVWRASAEINETGWTAELAIPLKSIRLPPVEEQTWSVTLGRMRPRDHRTIFLYHPINRNNPCAICQAPILSGIKNISSGSSVQFLPYVLGSQTSALKNNSQAGLSNGPALGRIGGSIKYAPNSAMVIEGVVNPDFSQVETDATQISINSTFALFYPERRPFFVEGADLFKNSLGTFYSRTINDPIAATKITGRSGAVSFAYLAAADRNTVFIIPGEEASSVVPTTMKSVTNIARARIDFGRETFIGAMVTARSLSDAHNVVSGLDWSYRFSGNYYFKGEAFLSGTKEVDNPALFYSKRAFGSTGHNAGFDGETYSGSAIRTRLSHISRTYAFSLNYTDISPAFQAQSGFITRNNMRELSLEQVYAKYALANWLSQMELYANTGIRYNYGDRRNARWVQIGTSAQMKGQTTLFVSYTPLNEEVARGIRFSNVHRGAATLSARPLRSLSGSLQVEAGRFVHQSDSPQVGRGYTLKSEIKLKPTPRFQIVQSCAWSRLSSTETGALLYKGYIARTMMTYQFTPELSARMIGQYDQFTKTLDIYPLISYKINPFTVFYTGLTSSMKNLDDARGLQSEQRQFFLKLQYLVQG